MKSILKTIAVLAIATVGVSANAREWNVQINTPGVYLSTQPYYVAPAPVYQPQYQPYYQPGVRIQPYYAPNYYQGGRPIVYPENNYQFRPPYPHHHRGGHHHYHR